MYVCCGRCQIVLCVGEKTISSPRSLHGIVLYSRGELRVFSTRGWTIAKYISSSVSEPFVQLILLHYFYNIVSSDDSDFFFIFRPQGGKTVVASL